MKVTTIIFDVDGVLLDSNKILADLHKKTAKELGLKIPTDREISTLWGREWKEIIKTLWPNVDMNLFIQAFKKIADIDNLSFPPVSNAIKTIKKLKKCGFKLSIVSARPRFSIKHLERAGFNLKLFDVIVTSDDTQNHKPNPEPILYACNLLKIKPKEAVYVGDSLSDFKAAKRANVKFVGVLSGDVKEKEFTKNGVKNIISSVDELPKFLKL